MSQIILNASLYYDYGDGDIIQEESAAKNNNKDDDEHNNNNNNKTIVLTISLKISKLNEGKDVLPRFA